MLTSEQREQEWTTYPSELVSTYHNICGRRTIRKPCDCRVCQHIRAAYREVPHD